VTALPTISAFQPPAYGSAAAGLANMNADTTSQSPTRNDTPLAHAICSDALPSRAIAARPVRLSTMSITHSFPGTLPCSHRPPVCIRNAAHRVREFSFPSQLAFIFVRHRGGR
jgi:hypothetical protein